MTPMPQSLPFDAPQTRQRKPSLTDKLEAYLMAREGRWVAVMDMAAVVGTSGVRQRRLECEQRGVWLAGGSYREGAYGFLVMGRRPADQPMYPKGPAGERAA
jgi:hypothetical protein